MRIAQPRTLRLSFVEWPICVPRNVVQARLSYVELPCCASRHHNEESRLGELLLTCASRYSLSESNCLRWTREYHLGVSPLLCRQVVLAAGVALGHRNPWVDPSVGYRGGGSYLWCIAGGFVALIGVGGFAFVGGINHCVRSWPTCKGWHRYS